MDLAYAAANLVIARAGAITCAEITVMGKASLLVPSPNVAEDHQTKNALALVNKGAALMMNDNEIKEKLIPTMIQVLNDKDKLKDLSIKSKKLGIPDADKRIVDEVLKLVS
jgi:UDP-N-acetylglucosamine--N-acetylmuramyl-(pentapeptide) pyrophosphoryl-undecaprenol N-acetylglucosamine transferase